VRADFEDLRVAGRTGEVVARARALHASRFSSAATLELLAEQLLWHDDTPAGFEEIVRLVDPARVESLQALWALAHALAALGRKAESDAVVEKISRKDPVFGLKVALGALFRAGRPDEAVARARAYHEKEHSRASLALYCDSLASAGRHEELLRVAPPDTDDMWVLVRIVYAHAFLGHAAEARSALARLRATDFPVSQRAWMVEIERAVEKAEKEAAR
jgi:hypothetical protein